MSKKDLENLSKDSNFSTLEFELRSLESVSSSANVSKINEDERQPFLLKKQRLAEFEASAFAKSGLQGNEGKEQDYVFRKLSEPDLPEIPKENRARLLMQSPTRLHFYWSVKNDPFQILNRAFGEKTNYTLIAKLVNLTRSTEEWFAVEADGNWWFNVDSDCNYRAEIGFYSPSRPYIRVMCSNEIRTPRKSPSMRTDYTPSFNIEGFQFAKVLEMADYRADAFEVAIASDPESAEIATRQTYEQLVGKNNENILLNYNAEFRFALLALASGKSIEDIRHKIDPSLYNKLSVELKNVTLVRVLKALKENFDIFSEDCYEEEVTSTAVFGASTVNFPKRIKKRSVPKTLLTKLSKLSNPDSLSSFQ